MNTRNVWLMLVDVKFFNLDKKITLTSSDVGIVIIIFHPLLSHMPSFSLTNMVETVPSWQTYINCIQYNNLSLRHWQSINQSIIQLINLPACPVNAMEHTAKNRFGVEEEGGLGHAE